MNGGLYSEEDGCRDGRRIKRALPRGERAHSMATGRRAPREAWRGEGCKALSPGKGEEGDAR